MERALKSQHPQLAPNVFIEVEKQLAEKDVEIQVLKEQLEGLTLSLEESEDTERIQVCGDILELCTSDNIL